MEPLDTFTIADELDQYQPQFEPASRSVRSVNYFIDLAVYYLCCILLLYATGFFVVGQPEHSPTLKRFLAANLTYYPAFMVLYVVYYLVFEGFTAGISPGKALTGTLAVKKDITPITWRHAITRSFCRLIPLDTIFAFTKGAPLHDTITGTTVILKSKIVW